jgi:GNAT superfamily N-acetyltransferase
MTRIRGARREDAPRLAALSGELGYPMTADDAVRRLADLESHGDHALLVAETDGRVAGWIQVCLPRIFETPKSAEIAGLVVDSAERGRGVGRDLVAAAAGWAAERGCVAVRVRTNVIRERAHAFYVREGFLEVKTQKVLEKKLPSKV